MEERQIECGDRDPCRAALQDQQGRGKIRVLSFGHTFPTGIAHHGHSVRRSDRRACNSRLEQRSVLRMFSTALGTEPQPS